MKKICFIIVLLCSTNVFASEIDYSFWSWIEYLKHSPGQLQETGIGINVKDNYEINSLVDYNNTVKYQIGYYDGFLIPKIGQTSIESFKTHVERLSWRGSLEYKLHPNLSALTELDTDFRSIDTFGSNWTTEAYLTFQPGLRVKPLSNQNFYIDVLHPFIYERSSHASYNPKSVIPLIRIGGKFDFDKSSSFSFSAEYLKTEDTEEKFFAKENRYYYQPAFQKMSLNLNYKKLF